ncbi:unnamed protein product [Closterium sp. Naga37s-1]|nr:unnamed protein product [Closterium sp. Naga37s-1]
MALLLSPLSMLFLAATVAEAVAATSVLCILHEEALLWWVGWAAWKTPGHKHPSRTECPPAGAVPCHGMMRRAWLRQAKHLFTALSGARKQLQLAYTSTSGLVLHLAGWSWRAAPTPGGLLLAGCSYTWRAAPTPGGLLLAGCSYTWRAAPGGLLLHLAGCSWWAAPTPGGLQHRGPTAAPPDALAACTCATPAATDEWQRYQQHLRHHGEW